MFKGLDKKQLALSAGIILATIAIGGGAYWQLVSYKTGQSSASPSPSADDQSEIAFLIRSVKQLVDIQTDETPTVATVTSKDKVRSQPFFAAAEIGDKVVVFPKAGKVVLFRPSNGKVINLAALGQESSQSAALASPSAEQSVSVVIRNGTTKAGLASKFETTVKSTVPRAKTLKENAAKQNYPNSVIVVINSSAQTVAEQLANKLGLMLGAIPEGETNPSADILIILGADKAE